MVKFTEMSDDRVAHILGHLHRHARIVQAHHIEFFWQLQLQKRINPSAHVEQVLQLCLLINERLRGGPHHRVIGHLGGLPGFVC